MKNRSITTKDIGLLNQLYRDNQLCLRPEFQRLSVWPRAAKAYLIDTILNEKPMPLFFFQRSMSAQTGRQMFDVIDGQQRLRAIFEYVDDEFGLTESKGNSSVKHLYGKRFSQLPPDLRARLFNYDLIVEELHSYTDEDIWDMFVRMNRFVVKLSKQELRHSVQKGKFAEYVERLGQWKFWEENRVFSVNQLNRMRNVEFAAELTVLLLEGPQDKKKVIDYYYHTFQNKFPEGARVEGKLREYLRWIEAAFKIGQTRFRKPVDLYGLIGAIDKVTRGGDALASLDGKKAAANLKQFEASLGRPQGEASTYLLAASRQTDNLIPRTARIEILASVITR